MAMEYNIFTKIEGIKFVGSAICIDVIDKDDTAKNNEYDCIIAVHDGIFHTDDVLCVALVMMKRMEESVEEQFIHTLVIRTRDKNEFDRCDYVLDVGGVDSVTSDCVRFDHHQPDSKSYENGIKMAACGKLARYFYAESDPGWLEYLKVNVLYGIEAQDNGQDGFPTYINPFGFINVMNPNWNEPSEYERRFVDAVSIVLEMLGRYRARYDSVKEAEEYVNTAIEHSERGIIVLEQFAPWVNYVCKYNATKNNDDEKIKFVVFKSSTGSWNVQTVRIQPDKFDSIKLLPEEWAGKNGVELDESSGIEGGVFCHIGRFICGWKTKEAAIEAAKKANSL